MEDNNREPFIGKLLFAFLISISIFTIIFFISYQVSYSNYIGIKGQNTVINQSLSEMKNLLNGNLSCKDSILLRSSQILEDSGERISILEQRLGFDDPIVRGQKKIYSQLELNHYRMILLFNKKCSKNFLPFLFFYSNKKNKFENQKVSSILSSFKIEFQKTVMVYSFDSGLNDTPIQDLIKLYNLTSFPVVVSPENKTLYLKNINQLYIYLNKIKIS